MNITEAIKIIESFSADSIASRISSLELNLKSKKRLQIIERLHMENIDQTVVQAALQVKHVAAQINVIVHAAGILTSLPYILTEDEVIESLSLGAGNTGREFDITTNKCIAEFKFIEWQGGSESIRQNNLFIDFFTLVEHKSDRKRFLYLIGANNALKFLGSNRSLKSVLSKNRKISDSFFNLYDKEFKVVSDYYKAKRDSVEIVDLQKLIPAVWGVDV